MRFHLIRPVQLHATCLSAAGAALLFTVATVPSNTFAQATDTETCSVIGPSGTSLSQAQALFSTVCPDQQRRDCDPIGDRWQCSSALINNQSPVGGTAIDTSPSEQRMCISATTATRELAIQSFQARCEGLVVLDCDPVGSGWVCGSGVLGPEATTIAGAGAIAPSNQQETAEVVNQPNAGPVVNNKALLFAGYEASGLDSGVAGVEGRPPVASDSITISSDLSRSGSQSVNHKIRLSRDYESFGAWRAESNSIGVLPSRYDQGDRIRYEFSIFLPSSWDIDDTDSVDIIWQWKRFSSRPDMFVQIRGNDIDLRGVNGSRITVLEDYRRGEWIDLRFDVLHSASNDGSVDLYYRYANKRGYILADQYSGPTMLASGPVDSTYLKWGLYKPNYNRSAFPNGVRSIFHDHIRVRSLPLATDF